MKRRFDLYLEDILECIRRVKKYTHNLDLEEFKKNQLKIDATARNLEIIGEAASQLQEWVKKKYTNVPWQDITDFRNVVIHKYHTLDMSIIWDIIEHKLEPLEKQVQEILKKEKK